MTPMTLGYKKPVTSVVLHSLSLGDISLEESKVSWFKQPYCEAHVVRSFNFWSTASEELSLPTTPVLGLEADLSS